MNPGLDLLIVLLDLLRCETGSETVLDRVRVLLQAIELGLLHFDPLGHRISSMLTACPFKLVLGREPGFEFQDRKFFAKFEIAGIRSLFNVLFLNDD